MSIPRLPPALFDAAMGRAKTAISHQIIGTVADRGGDRGDVIELMSQIVADVVITMVDANDPKAHEKIDQLFVLITDTARKRTKRASTMKLLRG